MAGGYITEDGFVEDCTQETAPQELSTESVCGATVAEDTSTSTQEQPLNKLGE